MIYPGEGKKGGAATNGTGRESVDDVRPAEEEDDVMHIRDCVVCGKPFEATRADAQYCSNACRQTAYRGRVTDSVTDTDGRVTDNQVHPARVTDNPVSVTDNGPVTDNQGRPAPVTDNPEVSVTDNPVRKTAPETMQAPPDVPTRNDQVMAALEVLAAQAPERAQQAREDARKLQTTYSEDQRIDWTTTQEARLAWEVRGREVKQLTSAQAIVGNRVIYRHQLGA